MKVEILQENLSKALSVVTRFVSTRATLPILTNTLLRAKGTRLILQGTNLEASISTSIGAKISEEGEIAIPARFLHDLVSNLGKGNITMNVARESVLLTTDNFESTIGATNSADFPSVPQVLGDNPICVDSSNMVDALSKTLFAVSTDETRPILTGVLIAVAKNQLVMVGTDGHRLSQKRLDIAYGGKDQKVIIPKLAVSEVLRLSALAEKVCIDTTLTEGNVLFGLEQTVLATRVIEGDFPDFSKIIPKEKRVSVKMAKVDLLRGIKVASVFSRDMGSMGRIKVSEGSVTVLAQGTNSGEQKMTIEAKVEGENVEISYNLRFIEEFLNVIAGEEVTMEFTDSTSPGVFRDSGDPTFLHLVMPVKLN